jgi:hypothetical protein
MTDPIDYSRPVGWWCTNSGLAYAPNEGGPLWCSGCIPHYLPLPTPEPVEVDEVETGDAEVVTFSNPLDQCRLATVDVCITD